MPTEISAVKVEPQPSVNPQRPEATSAAASGEETMEQYAARREAEMRGEEPPKPAAVTDKDKPATATEKSAAATDEAETGDRTTSAPAPDEDENPEAKIEEAHPAKKGINRKFSKLTSARDAAIAEAQKKAAEAETARKEAEEARAEVARLKLEASHRPAVPKAEEDPAPTRDDFEDPDAYQAALTAHAARTEIRKANELAEAQAKERRDAEAAEAETKRQAKVQEQITALHKTFNERVAQGKTEYPDYDAKVTNNEKLLLRNDVFFTIERSELSPHILYYLADNPSEAASLNGMDPIAVALRLGEIQSEIRIARKPKPSKAADPVRPVGHRQSPERKTPDEETMEEYAARREREERDKRAAARGRAH